MKLKYLLIAILLTTLAGCASAPQVPTTPYAPTALTGVHHTVRAGQTLYGISRMYGVDIDVLVRTNHLQGNSCVANGQVLIIPIVAKPKEEPAYSAVSGEGFVWPLRGASILPYGEKIDGIINKGIDIVAREGQDVKAARSGRVVYCDTHLKGFGNTIILDHGEGYETVYAYNSQILVKVGDLVQQDDVIAKVGRTGRAKGASLHFEIRKNGETKNPEYYLTC